MPQDGLHPVRIDPGAKHERHSNARSSGGLAEATWQDDVPEAAAVVLLKA
jgi:hypothetical protein